MGTAIAPPFACPIGSAPSGPDIMTFQELETQLLNLTPSEQSQMMQTLMQTLGKDSRGITKTPGVCGGDACIANTRIPIWVIVEARSLGYSEADLLTSYPALTATDLTQAWIYAETYPDEIAMAIQVNEAA
jgi:uncharacterized protein (DUF433 family)